MLQRIKNEWETLLLALGFLTRLPIPEIKNFTEEKFNHASRYFPLTGLLIGTICATVFYLAQLFFSPLIAAIFSIIAGLVLTGAFHEDGLADTFDGFGGAFSTNKKLSIMKDSRIGTYGSVALWSALSLKVTLLIELNNPINTIIAAHVLSRAIAISLTSSLDYVQDTDTSKSKPLAKSLSATDSSIITLTALSSLLLIPYQALAVCITLLVIRQSCIIWFRKQISGFTGDTLGACQQISEIGIYAAVIIATGAT